MRKLEDQKIDTHVTGIEPSAPVKVSTPFTKRLECSAVSVNVPIKDLLKRAKAPHVA